MTTKPKKPAKTAEKPNPEAVLEQLNAAQKIAEPKKTGRPSSYNQETVDKICELLSEGVPLREICRMDGMPAWRNIYFWMAKDENLSAHIARAREVGYDQMAEECLHIADNPKWGQEQTMSDDGTTTSIKDMLGHRKLQIETRLKLLAKWNPKKYGDKLDIGGQDGNPVQVNVEAKSLLAEVIKNLELKRQTNV